MREQLSLHLEPAGVPVALEAGAWLLPALASGREAALGRALRRVLVSAPLRHMSTTRGHKISVGMTNCGSLGWVSDARGYRYSAHDPETASPWPQMPAAFRELARKAADMGGFPGFEPDACLVNCYAAGDKMGLHQDRDERDLGCPIVSVSLGLSADFLFGGNARRTRVRRVPLAHGDVVVWGGPARLRFHGVAPVSAGFHPFWGERRVNLTFRRAG